MKTCGARLAAIAGFALLGAVPALAHHSVAGVFDISKPVTATGVVQKVEWINPHIVIYLEVTDAKGQKAVYSLETFPPAFFKRANVSRTDAPIDPMLNTRLRWCPTRVRSPRFCGATARQSKPRIVNSVRNP